MFTKASQVQKKLKVLIYGPSGSGKTHMALTFPKPAVIDMEGGTDLFADRFDFAVLRTKDHDEVMQAVEYIAANPDQYETLIIDPITVLWQVLMEAGQMMAEDRAKRKGRSADEASLTQRDWGIIKRKVNALYTRLVNMPCHVVMVGRIKDVNETRGQNVVKVGEKVDAEKSTEYMFDVVIKLTSNGSRIGLVEKDRSGKLQGQKIENPTFAMFADILKVTSTGTHVEQTDPTEAAAKTAKTMELDTAMPTIAKWPELHDATVKQLGYNHAAHVKNTLKQIFNGSAGELTFEAAWAELVKHQQAKDEVPA